MTAKYIHSILLRIKVVTHLPAASVKKENQQTCYLSSINGHRIDNVKLSNWVGILHKATSAVATQVYSCRIQIILKLNHDFLSRHNSVADTFPVSQSTS